MNSYNIPAAQEVLEEAQRWLVDEKNYLHSIANLPGWQSRYGVVSIDSPVSWRLVDQSKGDEEEIVFTLQGVIEGKDLPPIVDTPHMPRTKLPFLNQNLTLTGLDTAQFEQSLDAITALHGLFERQFMEGRMIGWQPPPSTLDSGRSLILSNRYFTRRSEAKTMKSVPFSPKVDPKGYLADVLSTQLIHTQENEVQYLTRVSDMGKQYKYLAANPQSFRIGDIVEVEFSLVAYRMRTEHYILKPMLYSVVLLDGEFANQLFRSKSPSINFSHIGRPMKRRAGYIVDMVSMEGREEEEARIKRRRGEEDIEWENGRQTREKAGEKVGDATPSQLKLGGMHLD